MAEGGPVSKTTQTRADDDTFALYDLSVVVEAVGPRCTCTMSVGDRFVLEGGKIAIPGDAKFCLYALQAVLPILPAKQRRNQPADWMETDAICTCPDPACELRMRINRDGVRTFKHDDVSALPWDSVKPRP